MAREVPQIDENRRLLLRECWEADQPGSLPLGSLHHSRLKLGLVAHKVHVGTLFQQEGVLVHKGKARHRVRCRGRGVTPKTRQSGKRESESDHGGEQREREGGREGKKRGVCVWFVRVHLFAF